MKLCLAAVLTSFVAAFAAQPVVAQTLREGASTLNVTGEAAMLTTDASVRLLLLTAKDGAVVADLNRALDWNLGAVSQATADYGSKFIVVSGLLNFICVADAYHIAIGKKR